MFEEVWTKYKNHFAVTSIATFMALKIPQAQINAVKVPLARTTASKNTNHFDIRIYADGRSVDEIIDELIPKLKLALANL